MVFGGLQGLEASVDADQNLEVTNPSDLFDLYLNTCPGQGSRTIRTEVSAVLPRADKKHLETLHSGKVSASQSTCCSPVSSQQEAILISMAGLRRKITAAFSDGSLKN